MSELLGQLGYGLDPSVVAAELAAEPGTQVIVAELDAEVVGMLAFHVRRHFQLARTCVSIDALVVDERRHSTGIGEALIEAAVTLSGEAGAASIDVNSDIRRVNARRFYERLGFEIVSNHFRRRLDER